MTITILLHVSNEDPVVGEVEEMPDPSHQSITVNNPRLRDGKDLPYLAGNVVTVMWPMHRINFIEIMPTAADEEVIGFVRE